MAIAAKLDHPNIVRILDSGCAGDCRYCVMEFVAGESVRKLLDSNRLDVAKTLSVIRQAGEALIYAHSNRVVHRDIKPDNLMITAAGVVKVIDFGIAHEEEVDDLVESTATRTIMGSPSYMSPEQGRSDPNIDHRTDIYSLGVTFYEMLSGNSPSGLLRQDLLPSGLREIIVKAMAYNPQDRYPSVQAMLEDMAKFEATGAAELAQTVLDQVAENDRLRRVLVEMLYPRQVPSSPAFELAQLYLPAAGVGGNYYDFLQLDERHLGILVGNVSDRPDARSALFLTMIRSIFRLVARETHDPAAVMKRVNALVAAENVDKFAVFSYLVADLETRQVTIACAGFRPALLFSGTRQSLTPIQAGGLGLGIDPEADYENATVAIAPGDVLLLSSAGMLSVSNLQGAEFGLDRLTQVLQAHHQAPPATIIAELEKTLRRFSAGLARRDDITVIALKFPDQPGPGIATAEPPPMSNELPLERRFSAEEKDLPELLRFVAAHARRVGMNASWRQDLELAVEEAVANICHHAYGRHSGPLILRIGSTPTGAFQVEIEDEGPEFNPLARPLPEPGKNLDSWTVGGLGILLMRRSVDSVDYERRDGRNLLRLQLTDWR
jgi:anti-sigma regulatory factor (Ser/Thr protein kinase)